MKACECKDLKYALSEGETYFDVLSYISCDYLMLIGLNYLFLLDTF